MWTSEISLLEVSSMGLSSSENHIYFLQWMGPAMNWQRVQGVAFLLCDPELDKKTWMDSFVLFVPHLQPGCQSCAHLKFGNANS